MIEHASPPSRSKLVLDQEIVPVPVNAPGALEGGLAQAAGVVRTWPRSVRRVFALAYLSGRMTRRV